jgi:hypothetical protein
MRLLGSHFVLGQTIKDALSRAASSGNDRYSYDMLGEGARTADDAERYFQSYANAIAAIGKSAGKEALPARPGISVKLSALHPRYEALGRDRVLRELSPKFWSWRAPPGATISTSPSMPKRPTGSNCRSRSLPGCCAIRRWPAGMASDSPSRLIRSAPVR